jgi:hypothetical protein
METKARISSVMQMKKKILCTMYSADNVFFKSIKQPKDENIL